MTYEPTIRCGQCGEGCVTFDGDRNRRGHLLSFTVKCLACRVSKRMPEGSR